MEERILVISPHGDDGELGCGGTISRFSEEHADIYYVVFSDAKNVMPEGFAPDALRNEIQAATTVLGIKGSNVRIYEFETRNFGKSRQEILDELISIRDTIEPSLIFAPTTRDVHQDHKIVTDEVLRTFKKGQYTILGYEQPWNCFIFNTTAFVCLEERHIEKKIAALREYKSQAGRNYLNEDFLRGLAITRGTQIGHRYAEAFEVLRYVIK